MRIVSRRAEGKEAGADAADAGRFYKRKPDPKNPQAQVRDLTKPRHPDVLVKHAKSGQFPQYEGGTAKGLLLEEDGKKMEITAEMLRHADDYVVCGCRTMNPNDLHRGLSLFNGVVATLPFNWANAPLP